MASTDEVKKLAALARIEVAEAQLPKLAQEFESILAYIGQIEALKVVPGIKTLPRVRNVFREDKEPHEKGKYTKALVAQFPDQEGNTLKVKQIISHD
jgi:aspartyl/glutamyl-tRNA(Asn/Gln) amidotransferase C subunit